MLEVESILCKLVRISVAVWFGSGRSIWLQAGHSCCKLIACLCGGLCLLCILVHTFVTTAFFLSRRGCLGLPLRRLLSWLWLRCRTRTFFRRLFSFRCLFRSNLFLSSLSTFRTSLLLEALLDKLDQTSSHAWWQDFEIDVYLPFVPSLGMLSRNSLHPFDMLLPLQLR
jgi:hypothetical protein